jgi:predicted dehydrogenase
MELYGTAASLFVPDPNFFGGDVDIGEQSGDITTLPAWDHSFGVVNDDEGRANYRCAGLADMAAAIIGQRDHRCSIDLAVHAVDVMTAILRAGEERRWVDLTTTCDRPTPLSPDDARGMLV